MVGHVPNCKFQVLNETSLWWFDKTQHITPNAVVSAPDKNVTIAKKCSVFPVEFVGRCLIYCFSSISLLIHLNLQLPAFFTEGNG